MTVLLGRTTSGTTADFESSGWTLAWDFVAVANGTLAAIFAQTKVANGSFSSARLGIYSHDTPNDRPNALLTDAAVSVLADAQGTGQFNADVSAGAVSINSGTKYWLAFSGTGETINFQGDAVSTYEAKATTFPATWGVSDNPSGTTGMLIWGDDTPATPPPGPIVPTIQKMMRAMLSYR